MIILSFDDLMKFTTAARKAIRDEDYAEFECPICGATAKTERIHGKHIKAKCDKCRANFFQ